MVVNKYHVKHKRQNIIDFNSDCHRFSFWYNNKEMEASCYGSVDVLFNDGTIPEDVKCEVQNKIYQLIDKYEYSWSVPKAAQEIADKYCKENFY